MDECAPFYQESIDTPKSLVTSMHLSLGYHTFQHKHVQPINNYPMELPNCKPDNQVLRELKYEIFSKIKFACSRLIFQEYCNFKSNMNFELLIKF